MSYQKRAGGTPLRGTRDSVENADGAEHRVATPSRKGREFADDDATHLRSTGQPLSPLNRSSLPPIQSPLFEPEDAELPEHMSILDGEAEPESEQEPEQERSPPPPLYNTPLDGLKRARAIKSELSKGLKILQSKGIRARGRTVEEDPENQEIKTLRQEHSMSWEAIVQHLNQERLQRGEPATLTTAAVYSRFVRNAPRIAAVKGEIGFDPKDYMYLRNPAQHPAASLPGAVHNPSGYSFGAGGGRKRVRNDEKAAENLADNMRHSCLPTLSEQAKVLEEGEVSARLMSAVASVEKDFWRYVASALEKETGKWFEPTVLESRYHAI